ncbi:hypothetical protein [Bosea sp. RAC05]|uniref:hypothetical protein n=1 Tax=Bosea sp. RAC05 TaxID=1842539 RepID=UPI00083D9248|nr:hypothetical protein [Bosea sp. RAC05]AOG02935.1 hypothetical protein BSY19_5403 [Bosea sp. RAC05]
MSKPSFKRYLTVVRAPDFGAPFDDGAWHLIVESDDHDKVRSTTISIIPWIDDIGAEAMMLKVVEGKSRGSFAFKPVVMKKRDDLAVPAPEDIVRNDAEELRNFTVVIEASRVRFNPKGWVEFLERNPIETLPQKVQQAIQRLVPVIRGLPRAAPARPGLRQWLTSATGAWTMAGALSVIAITSIAAVVLVSNHNAEKDAAMMAMMQKYREGAVDIVKMDGFRSPQWVRTRVYPDGRVEVVEREIDRWANEVFNRRKSLN